MITAGFDVGTRFVKVCIMDDGALIGHDVRPVTGAINRIINDAFDHALRAAGVKKRRVRHRSATGYGAGLVRNATLAPETLCMARGAGRLDADVRTVVNVGALFVHAVSIRNSGRIGESAVNDRCASGGGRLIEMAADALKVPLAGISDRAMASVRPVVISGNCTVFAESEIISRKNSGAESADIAAGVFASVASRTATLVNQIYVREKIVLVGGVARFDAFRFHFEQQAGRCIAGPPMDPHLLSAYGAALCAGRTRCPSTTFFKN